MTTTYSLDEFAARGVREAQYVASVRENSPSATTVIVAPLWCDSESESWTCDSSDGFPVGGPD